MGVNCEGFKVTEAEWSLLQDSKNILAYEQLGLDSGAYERDFEGPAYSILDSPGACVAEGPYAETVLAEFVGPGGSRDPLPDQDATYEEWQVRREAWDAVAGNLGNRIFP